MDKIKEFKETLNENIAIVTAEDRNRKNFGLRITPDGFVMNKIIQSSHGEKNMDIEVKDLDEEQKDESEDDENSEESNNESGNSDEEKDKNENDKEVFAIIKEKNIKGNQINNKTVRRAYK